MQMVITKLVGAKFIVGSIGLVLLLSGCGQSSLSSETAQETTATEVSRTVSKFDVTSNLQPLAEAVVFYTDTDYGETPSSAATVSLVEKNLKTVQSEARKWKSFVSQISYGETNISGLESAIRDYNAGLDQWLSTQNRGLEAWRKCLAENNNDLTVSVCLLSEQRVEEELSARDNYIRGLEGLFVVLGVR